MKIKVNGKEYLVNEHLTILEFLKKIGIYIPYLCYHPNLRPVGSCRVCVIKDRGRYKNSCATYLEDGMEIETHSSELIEIRKWILQFLFGERNHYCMYCSVTNDCEFQRLGYYTGLDHFHFNTFENLYELDNSHERILFDNNRCVLCSRCIRACNELAGHFVLSEINKGIKSLVVADGGLPLGQSSCTSCGLCVQVCPTGTFVDKYSMYLGRSWECEKIYSYCFECPVGCGIEIYTRKGNLVKIFSNWNSFSKGLICYKGRYQAVYDYRDLQKKTSYKKIDITRDYLFFKDLLDKNKDAVAVIDGTLFNEEIKIIGKLFSEIYSLYPINPLILENDLKFEELDNYEVYIIDGWDLNKDYGTIGSVIKRNVYYKNYQLILYQDLSDQLVQELENRLPKVLFLYKNFHKLSPNKQKIMEIINKVKHLVLPVSSNDLGILKILGEIKELEVDKIKNRKVFVFTRDLKKDLYFLDSKNSFLFTCKESDYSKIFENLYILPSWLELDGAFYNLFNREIVCRAIVGSEMVK